MSIRRLAAIAGGGVLLIGASAAHGDAPRLLWNVTASAPTGAYLVRRGAPPAVGDLVAYAPDPPLAAWLDAARYAPHGTLLLKRMAAGPGAVVCRTGVWITLDGRPAASARPRDRSGRALPTWGGCRRLRAGEILLLNAPTDSVDSRYFGPVRASGVLGIAHRLGAAPTSGRRP